MTTLYVVVYPSSLSIPSAAQIIAGQDSTGSPAAFSDSVNAPTDSTYTFPTNDLNVGETYQASFVWSGTDYTSAVATSDPLVIGIPQGGLAAYSLRDIWNGGGNVVRLRRSGDDAERDFTAAELVDGTLESWAGALLSPIAYWKCNEVSGTTFNDTAGTYQGSLTSTGILYRQPDPFGNNSAMGFRGGSATIAFSSSLIFGTGTLSFWVKRNGSVQESFAPIFWWDGNNTIMKYFTTSHIYWDGYKIADSALDGSWHHVLVTIDGIQFTSYVDGALAESFSKDLEIDTTLRIGYSAIDELHFDICEIAAFNEVLTLDQIQSIYNSSQISSTQATTLYDQSGNGKHAVQNDADKQPQLVVVDDKPRLRFDGVDDYLDCGLVNDGTKPANFSAYMVGKFNSDGVGVGSTESAAIANYDDYILALNPILYWKMDETSGTTIFDAGTSQYNANIGGGAITSEDGLHFSSPKSIRFNTSTWASAGNKPEFSSSTLSIELWVKVGASRTGKDILRYGRTNNLTFRWRLGDNGAFYLYDNSGSRYDISVGYLSTDILYHIVITMQFSSSSGLKGYKNGILVDSKDIYFGPGGITFPTFLINRDPYSSTDFTLDGVALYNRILTPEEIEEHYNFGLEEISSKNSYSIIYRQSSKLQTAFGDGTNATEAVANNTLPTTQSIYGIYYDGGNTIDAYVNGTQQSLTYITQDASSSSGTEYKMSIGRPGEFDGLYFEGDVSEVLVYALDLTPKRTGIESELDLYYSVLP